MVACTGNGAGGCYVLGKLGSFKDRFPGLKEEKEPTANKSSEVTAAKHDASSTADPASETLQAEPAGVHAEPEQDETVVDPPSWHGDDSSAASEMEIWTAAPSNPALE